MLMALSVWLGVPPVVALMTLWVQEGGLLHRSSRWRVLGTSLDDLVEFPSIEPNAPALRAIINLHPLSLAHHEGNMTDGTWHTGGAGHRWAS